jgi:uncharacterized protein (DUF1330 family)
VDVQINDPAAYEEYKKLTPAFIASYGGKFIVRGGKTETLEGEWNHGRIVIIEFRDAETARLWWNSPGYAPAKKIRQGAANTNMVLVEGAVPF